MVTEAPAEQVLLTGASAFLSGEVWPSILLRCLRTHRVLTTGGAAVGPPTEDRLELRHVGAVPSWRTQL
ncbi:hypothetical protein GCM10010313_14160 [Streptomyces violarus]|nr:hypothetical protein GCM10010313_14160 [Streptomyces violarus]